MLSKACLQAEIIPSIFTSSKQITAFDTAHTTAATLTSLAPNAACPVNCLNFFLIRIYNL
jgi:hypothetical protein